MKEVFFYTSRIISVTYAININITDRKIFVFYMARRFKLFSKKSPIFKIGSIKLGKPYRSRGNTTAIRELEKKIEKLENNIQKLERYYNEFLPLEEIHKRFYFRKTDKDWNDELQIRTYNINGSKRYEEILKPEKFSISDEEKKELFKRFDKETPKTATQLFAGLGILVITIMIILIARAYCCLSFFGFILFMGLTLIGSYIDGKNVDAKRNEEIEKLKKNFDYDEEQRLEELKKSLEENEPKRIEKVKKLLEGDMETINNVLSEVVNYITYPKETLVDFVIINKEKIFLDIDLPEIEDMPTEKLSISPTGRHIDKTISQKDIRKLYATVVHSIALSLASIVFSSIPTCNKVILSGYTQRISKKTGNTEDEYVYSIIIDKETYYKLNIPNTDSIEAFENFEYKRDITKTFILNTIEPYTIEQ